MYPLDVTMPQAGCCVAGGLEFGAGFDPRISTVRGHRPCLRRQGLFVSPPIQTWLSHAWCQACVELWPPREGGLHIRFGTATQKKRKKMLGRIVIVHHGHGEAASLVRGMCCGPRHSPGVLLYMSFRIADMIGNRRGHVSFLSTPKKKIGCAIQYRAAIERFFEQVA